MFEEAFAAPLDIEIIARSSWNAGYTLVAEKFQRGRIFLGGDAVHLFTPTGGLGYNTAVEDAVNLGWKLAAVLKGWGGAGAARQLRDRAAGDRPAQHRPTRAALPTRSDCSCRRRSWRTTDRPARRRASSPATISTTTPASSSTFPGITFGGRYDGSPIIVADGTAPPPDAVNTYQPTACPGGRAPHLWLADGRSLYDALGFEFTLLQLGGKPADPRRSAPPPTAMNMPLSVVPIASDEARDLYGADLALIRPDQIVAWRGNSTPDAATCCAVRAGHTE